MFGTEIVRVRPLNCYGPHEHFTPYRGFIPKFIYHALHDKNYIVYKGHKRIIDYVEDSCNTFANIVDNFIPSEVYNVGGRVEWEKDIKEYSDIDKPLGSEKFDVIVLGDFLQCIKYPAVFLKKLKDFLNTDGYLVLSITNIGHAYNRIKLLNCEFVYTEDGLINGNFLRFFTFETTLHLVSDANYSITKLYREKEDLDLVHRKDLKYFTIPDELIKSIKNDPESLVSKYVFSISPTSTGNSAAYDYLKEFTKSLTTERLEELIRYYKEDLSLAYDKKLEEKDSQIRELKKS